MADLVVDSNVWVASFLPSDEHHQRATQFVNELQARAHHCHLPYLVLVETCAAIARQTQRGRAAFVRRVQRSFEGWTQQGLISWYDLEQRRANAAVSSNVALPHPPRGADSVMASLASELGYLLMTYDQQILQRYPNATL